MKYTVWAALILSLIFSTSSRAEPVPSWSYNWQAVSGLTTIADGEFSIDHNLPGTSINYGLSIGSFSPTFSGWTIPNSAQQGTLGLWVGPTTDANKSGWTPFPANTYGTYNDSYTLRLNVKDNNSGQTGSVTFSGQFQGGFYQDVSNPHINLSHFVIGPSEQQLYLGSNRYVLDFGTFDPPTDGHGIDPNGPPYAAIFPGALTTTLTVTGTPEPATLMMGCFGLAGLGIGRILRRRKA